MIRNINISKYFCDNCGEEYRPYRSNFIEFNWDNSRSCGVGFYRYKKSDEKPIHNPDLCIKCMTFILSELIEKLNNAQMQEKEEIK